MYKKIERGDVCQSRITPRFTSANTEFHSQGYYLRGGLDLRGDALNLDAKVSYDSESDLASPSIQASAISNPRVGFFELVDMIGVEATEKQLSDISARQQTDTDDN